MRCSFCNRAGAFAFDGFMLCPKCASESSLALVAERGEIHAMLEWGGGAYYLYTASTADASPADQQKRLAANQKTLALIASSI
jgi:hypothetical protein